MPFLEILTRTIPGREWLLERCQESVGLLRDPDYVQRVIRDEKVRGVSWANRNYATIEAVGEWVWLLDDDDLCSDADLIAKLRWVIAKENPDVILMRTVHGRWGVLPDRERWGQRPVMGHIGPSCLAVKGAVWNAYRDCWTETYAGDFWFINDLWDAGLKVSWLPIIAGYQPHQNAGLTHDAR